jgi:DNA helicase-2/ATP-dependent DNA helicase PcrA
MKIVSLPAPSRESRNIIQTDAQRVEVMACPGSGKTTTAIARIRHLIGRGVQPADILVLSFSNAAARHFKERLRAFGVTVHTCHAFALKLIKKEWRLAGFPKRPELLKRKHTTQFILRVIGEVREQAKLAKKDATGSAKDRLQRKIAWLDYLVQARVIGEVWRLFTIAAVSLQPLTELSEESDARAIKSFDGRLQQAEKLRLIVQSAEVKSSRVTFESMVRLASEALNHSKSGLPPYRHLIVDEYQDCSPLQTQFIAALAQRIPNLLVLGDPLQGIYGFAGATYQQLGEVLEGVCQLPLSKSYRLTAQNAALADSIAGPLHRLSIKTTRGGPAPRLIYTPDATTQGRQVVQDICRLLEAGVDPTNIAVLARHKATLRPISKTLHAKGPASVQSGVTQHWDELGNLLRLLETFERYRAKSRSVGEQTLRKLLHLDASDAKWTAAAKDVGKITSNHLEARYKLCARAYLRLRGGLRSNKPLRNFLNEYQPLCRQFDSAPVMAEHIERLANATPILFSTIHAAKGREWDHVFIVGATEGLLPDHRAKSAAQVDEERRLLFVAVTRAKTDLRIYHAPAKIYGKKRTRFNKVSRFVESAMKDNLISVIGSKVMD